MSAPGPPSTKPPARVDSPIRRHPWAIVLAGGEGMRLRPLTLRVYGEGRPKQYAALMGPRTLLRQTLDRVALAVPPERTVVVTLAAHAPYYRHEIGAEPAGPLLLAQPTDRGTAAGILAPAHAIEAREPGAILMVFPSDHFVLEEMAFMQHMMAVCGWIARHPGWVVLLGARPTEAETEYGWIEPGDRIGSTPDGPLCRVARFREKPSLEVARRLLASGGLWNTFVLAAAASTLIELGRTTLPALHHRLARLQSFGGTPHEAWAIRQAYALAPAANFSRAVLQLDGIPLAVSEMAGLTWCDLGTPDRVARTLRRAGLRPPWLDNLERAQPAPLEPTA